MAGILNRGSVYLREQVVKRLPFLQIIKDSVPFRWFLDHQQHISYAFYFLVVAGCAYWLYHLISLDVSPRDDIALFHTRDTRDALVYVFFGLFGLAIVFFLVIFLLKFIYNMLREYIAGHFPARSHSLVKSICWLAILGTVFIYTENIKSTGLAAYRHMADMVFVASQHDEIAAENFSNMVNSIEKIKKGDLEDFIE